ncbi:MAG: hypothetical protein JJU33_07115 [Phycisphaerales bacterium]|nr:hypothetical protein [Phycisphaerales bacterium]
MRHIRRKRPWHARDARTTLIAALACSLLVGCSPRTETEPDTPQAAHAFLADDRAFSPDGEIEPAHWAVIPARSAIAEGRTPKLFPSGDALLVGPAEPGQGWTVHRPGGEKTDLPAFDFVAFAGPDHIEAIDTDGRALIGADASVQRAPENVIAMSVGPEGRIAILRDDGQLALVEELGDIGTVLVDRVWSGELSRRGAAIAWIGPDHVAVGARVAGRPETALVHLSGPTVLERQPRSEVVAPCHGRAAVLRNIDAGAIVVVRPDPTHRTGLNARLFEHPARLRVVSISPDAETILLEETREVLAETETIYTVQSIGRLFEPGRSLPQNAALVGWIAKD